MQVTWTDCKFAYKLFERQFKVNYTKFLTTDFFSSQVRNTQSYTKLPKCTYTVVPSLAQR